MKVPIGVPGPTRHRSSFSSFSMSVSRTAYPYRHTISPMIAAEEMGLAREAAMILVTGGLGFIGSHTVASLLKAGQRGSGDALSLGRMPSFLADKKFAIENLDVTSPHAIIEVARKHKIDQYHASGGDAARPVVARRGLPAEHVRPHQRARGGAHRRGQAHLDRQLVLDLWRRAQADRTARTCRCGSSGAHPTEAFKKAFEVLGRHYGDRTGIEVVCLRIGNVWGPVYHSMNNLASRLAHAAAKGQAAPLPRPNGRPDFAGDALDAIYVKDCAEGIRAGPHRAEARPRRLQYWRRAQCRRARISPPRSRKPCRASR